MGGSFLHLKKRNQVYGYVLLDWNDEEKEDFINDHKFKFHPNYYESVRFHLHEHVFQNRGYQGFKYMGHR